MKTNIIISVSLYLRGANLDPKLVSEKLGINPSSAQYKGEKKITSTNREYVAKIGVWELDADTKSPALSDHLDQLTSMINTQGIAIRSIAGVDEAYIDIFIAADANEDGGGTLEFELNKENIAALERLGLPIHYTVTHVDKKKAMKTTWRRDIRP
jgi:hypothetical protein